MRIGDERNCPITFSFLTLLYFAAFSIVSARERGWFWATMPSKAVLAAVVAETLIGTVLTFVGLKGLMPLPWWQPLVIFASAMFSCLIVNDAIKVTMIKSLILKAAAKRPVDVTSQVARRAYELYKSGVVRTVPQLRTGRRLSVRSGRNKSTVERTPPLLNRRL